MTTATATRWKLQGQGYEFCNCDHPAAGAQLKTTTPRATWPPRIAAKPSLISASV